MKEKKQKGKNRFIYRYIFLFLLLFLILSVFTFFILRMNYKNWEAEYNSADVLMVNLDEDLRELQSDLEKQILDYNMNQDNHTFLELSGEESLFLFSGALEESLPEGFRIKKMGLMASRGNWYIYFRADFKSLDLPWIAINLRKEEAQSVDIYVEDLLLGNMSFRRLFLGSLVDSINEGIKRSIRLVNDGNFAGKVFENIELREDSLVIRSRRVSF